jgi:sensor domain CHASE-containing protein
MANAHIDEKTKISLFAVVISLSSVIMATMWLAVLSSRTEQALAQSSENKMKFEKQTDLLRDIHGRVIRIEEKLSNMKVRGK